MISNSKFQIFLIALFLVSLLFAPLASAHILQSNGSIGAVLHIDPEDDPIAKQQAGFFFEFKDKEQKFKPENCECTFKIIEGGKEMYSQRLFQNNQNPSLSNASVLYTFPQKDIYQVIVTGKPLAPNSFQPFTLTYDIRVTREATKSSSPVQNTNWFSTHIIHLIGGIIILLFVLKSIYYG